MQYIFYVFLRLCFKHQINPKCVLGLSFCFCSCSFPLSTQGSDVPNGIVGFSLNSLGGKVLDEDSKNRTALLYLQRQVNR